jgi:hypothetical protein
VSAVYEITDKGRAALAGGPQDDMLSPAPGLSAAYSCLTIGCTDGTCDYCAWLRSWGARSVCVRCGVPLEQPPRVFVDRRPLCGECAG